MISIDWFYSFSQSYDSGSRLGEIMTLRNKDVDFDQYAAVLPSQVRQGTEK